jgi:hypothetical protein
LAAVGKLPLEKLGWLMALVSFSMSHLNDRPSMFGNLSATIRVSTTKLGSYDYVVFFAPPLTL